MDRSCTDIICCCLFLAFLLGLAGTSAYGFLNGDPILLLTTWDYDGKFIPFLFYNLNSKLGNGCGLNATTKDFPYLYFPGVEIEDTYEALKYSTCVKSCPTSDETIPVLCHEPSFFVD